jgi:hypothetical protein
LQTSDHLSYSGEDFPPASPIKDEKATEGDQHARKLAEVDRDPCITVGVLGEDDWMVILVAVRVELRDDRVQKEASNKKRSRQPEVVRVQRKLRVLSGSVSPLTDRR